MERKKLFQVLVTLFIAIIFITSYFSLTNYNTSSRNKTTSVPPTIFASGILNASVAGYGNILSIAVSCKNDTNSTINDFSTVLSALEANNSVSTYYSVGNRITVDLGNFNASALYSYLSQRASQAQLNCSRFSGSAVLLLPSVMKAQVQTSTYNVYIPDSDRRYPLPVTLPLNAANGIKVKVSTLITVNGTVYGNLSVVRV
ncbi:MAG: hypothetical protein KGH50_02255 [Candidatus Micrarchaeota archaeon]|nr:hypothetical protein [Candidatus Micrarchaeota archaeon]